MPESTHKPLLPETLSAEQSKFLIHSRLEIAMILGTLCKAGSIVAAHFGEDDDFFLTSIIAVRPEQDTVFVDYGADSAASERALDSGNITFVAEHERIKIQFDAESLCLARYGGRDVFGMAIPATLLRLQRREYFRIATPLTRPLVCVIAPQGAPARKPREVAIVDISCGGIAVIDSSVPASVETGVRYRGCRVLLPDIGAVTMDIMVKSTHEVTLKSGAKHTHAGCVFVDMPERDRALIQRYISKLERERKGHSGSR